MKLEIFYVKFNYENKIFKIFLTRLFKISSYFNKTKFSNSRLIQKLNWPFLNVKNFIVRSLVCLYWESIIVIVKRDRIHDMGGPGIHPQMPFSVVITNMTCKKIKQNSWNSKEHELS